MKSISALTDFYYKELYPKLQELESQRKRVRFRVLLISAFILLFGTILLASLAKENLVGFEFLIFLGIASVGLIGFIYKYLSAEYIQACTISKTITSAPISFKQASFLALLIG